MHGCAQKWICFLQPSTTLYFIHVPSKTTANLHPEPDAVPCQFMLTPPPPHYWGWTQANHHHPWPTLHPSAQMYLASTAPGRVWSLCQGKTSGFAHSWMVFCFCWQSGSMGGAYPMDQKRIQSPTTPGRHNNISPRTALEVSQFNAHSHQTKLVFYPW